MTITTSNRSRIGKFLFIINTVTLESCRVTKCTSQRQVCG